MKTFAFAGLSLVFALSLQAHAADTDSFAIEQAGLTEGTAVPATDDEINTAVTNEANTIAALPTDQAAAAHVQAQADQADQQADAAVKAGVMTPEQARVVHLKADVAREISKTKGFRHRLLSAIKHVGRDLGFAGEAVSVAWVTPVFAGAGFVKGVAVGDKPPTRKPAVIAIDVATIGGGVGAEVGGVAIADSIGAGWTFGVGLGFFAVNHLAAECAFGDTTDGTSYCRTIGAEDNALTTGAQKHSKSAGAKVRHFFAKIFK
jgi:hypothetical protein